MVLVISGVDHRHRIHLSVFWSAQSRSATSASVGSHLGRCLAQVLGLSFVCSHGGWREGWVLV